MRCFIYFFIRKLKEKNYCIDCGVLDGFLALKKTVTVRVQCYKISFLKISLISSISCVRFEYEWQSVGRSQSRVACRLAANKQFVFQTDNVAQNFLEAKVKQNTKIKPKITYLTWVMAFLAAENENRQLEDFPQADFGRVHKNVSFVDKEKVNNWFCEKKVTPIVFFCNGSTHFSS